MAMLATGGEGLTPNQQLALETILAGGSLVEAGVAGGVSRETVRQWLKQEDFRRELRAAKNEALEIVSVGLLVAGEIAVSTLADIAQNSQSDHARAKAADSILTNLMKNWEMMSVEDRLKALEDRLAADLYR